MKAMVDRLTGEKDVVPGTEVTIATHTVREDMLGRMRELPSYTLC